MTLLPASMSQIHNNCKGENQLLLALSLKFIRKTRDLQLPLCTEFRTMLGDSAESVGNVSKPKGIILRINIPGNREVGDSGGTGLSSSLQHPRDFHRPQEASSFEHPCRPCTFVDAGLLLSFCRRRRWLFEL